MLDRTDPADEDGGEGATRRVSKSPGAFRTISEVAAELGVPQHVLRFWETKFTQIRPLKRGGGRRYYRPEDVELLRRIRRLLHGEGYTIKGVQKLLREGGRSAAEPSAPPLIQPSLAAAAAALSDDQRDTLRGILDDLLAAREAVRRSGV